MIPESDPKTEREKRLAIRRAEYAAMIADPTKRNEIRERARMHYRNNRERIKAINAAYGVANRQRLQMASRKWREQNKESIREKRRAYYLANREKLMEQNKKRHEQNRDAILKQRRESYVSNKDKILLANKDYRMRDDIKERTRIRRMAPGPARDRYLELKRKSGARHRDKTNAKRAAYFNDPKIKARKAAYDRERRAKIGDKYKESTKAWIIKNRERYNARQRERRRIDPQFAISNNVRSRMNSALRNYGLKRDKPLEKQIGCSIEQLMAHLEEQFTDGMTWDARGRMDRTTHTKVWQIDHIKPCSAFDLSDPKQRAECFHYTNLKPLWAIDNIKKGGVRRPRARRAKPEPVQEDFIEMLLSA